MTTQPQWSEVWTWGGWIIPEKVGKAPVAWESTTMVSSWRAWEQTVLRKLSSQVGNKTNQEKLDLTQEDRLNTMLRWKMDAVANTNASAGLEAWIQAVQQWKKSILLWKQEYDGSNEKNQEALWKTFEELIQKVSGIQQAWWVLYQQIPVGTIESRRYWNYWWDLQRFYIEYFYYLGTPEQEKALYENAFRYGYDLEKKVGKFSANGIQYLKLISKQAPPAIKKGLMGLMKDSTAQLTKAVDGSQDWVYVFQEKTAPFLRSLDVQSLWSPSWNFHKYWVSLYEYLGIWDKKKGEPTETIMVPVRVMGNAEYWLSVWELWKKVEMQNGIPHLGGFPGIATPEGQRPVFYNFGALARSMLAPAPRGRRVRGQESAFVRELPTDWAQLWSVGSIRPVRVLCFTQDGVDCGLWEVLRMNDLNPRGVKTQPQQLASAAGRAHPLIWVSWVARLFLGQQMPLSGNATAIDLKMPLRGQQGKRGGASPSGIQWKDMARSVLNTTHQYLKTQEDRLGLSPADRRVIESAETFYKIEEEGTVQVGEGGTNGNAGAKTVRRWILESEKTGKAHMAGKSSK